MSKIGIYRFTNLINNKVYIGSSRNLTIRYNQHLKSLYQGSKLLKSAFNKYGFENFKFEILELIENNKSLNKKDFIDYIYYREQVYLDMYFAQEYINKENNLFREITYNLNPISKGSYGLNWTDEQKSKLKEKFKNHGHSCIGRNISLETRHKIGDKNKINSKGQNNPNYGNKSTLEKRNKVLNNWIKSGLIKPFYKIDKLLNIEGPFINITEYCKNNNLEPKGLHLCIKNKMRVYKNYTYCYKEDIDSKINSIKLLGDNYWMGSKFQIKNKINCTLIIKDFDKEYTFDTINQASELLNFSHTSLTKALKKGNKFIKNYEIKKYEPLFKN